METTDLCPHALSRRDAAALIGVLANLEAHIRIGDVDLHAVDHFHRRLLRDGAMTDGEDVPEALNRLNHRVRSVLGEYD